MQPKWSSSSSSTSAKLKTLFLNLITDIAKKRDIINDIPKKKKLIKDSLYRILQSLSSAKSIMKGVSKLNKKRLHRMMFHPTTKSSKKNHSNRFFLESSTVVDPFSFSLRGYEDDDYHNHDRYLEWVEEKVDDKHNNIDDDHTVENEERDVDDDDDDDDINRLADRFIAKCHERFMLEKVESFREYEEMLLRGL
ncbi:PREDICTED: uncharacterized protein LOC104788818 [Camelina sativa]|uniref:Uncharacterized protein LOC104788818 n=1 Tax=Camelina sativa TaxID=90675 RepID=A0ABM1RNY2_CAMSA|nr:PREDICTED: uncharacterized protein LOC104788818 [Camelina sativa]